MKITASKRNLLFATLTIAGFAIVSCNHFEKMGDKSTAKDTMAVKKVEEVKSYDIALVDNKKDPTCGMPLTAGINDTAHYKDKVIGFCSAECKAEFVKNPVEGMKTAELK